MSLLIAALSETEVALEKQLARVEQLEQTLFELQGEIAAGHHVPPGVRVLSLKQNPAQEWSDLRQAVMNRLKGENEALIKRLKELEENGSGKASSVQGGDLVPRESWEVVNKEKTELEDVVKQKEKRLLRLQQVCFCSTFCCYGSYIMIDVVSHLGFYSEKYRVP